MEFERPKINYPKVLSRALSQWVSTHGYRYSTELAAELDIPKRTWNRSIITGDNIVESVKGHPDFDTRNFYARLHLWTDLEEADPRNIPDRVKSLPRGGVTGITRRFTEDEYQAWLNSPEAKELLARKNERFKRGLTVTAEPEVQKLESTETVGTFIGTFIDNMIRRGASQLADILSERQAELVSAQFRGLEDRMGILEGAMTRVAVQIVGQQTHPASPQPRSSRVNTSDIGQLSNRLKDALDAYRTGTSDDRDKLMQIYGTELMALDIAVHTLTRRPSEREENLTLTKETRL